MKKNKNFLKAKKFFFKIKFFRNLFFVFLLFFIFSENSFSEWKVVQNISEAEKNIEKWILPFWDVSKDNPAKDAILELYRRNIITWYKDQTLGRMQKFQGLNL